MFFELSDLMAQVPRYYPDSLRCSCCSPTLATALAGGDVVCVLPVFLLSQSPELVMPDQRCWQPPLLGTGEHRDGTQMLLCEVEGSCSCS